MWSDPWKNPYELKSLETKDTRFEKFLFHDKHILGELANHYDVAQSQA